MTSVSIMNKELKEKEPFCSPEISEDHY